MPFYVDYSIKRRTISIKEASPVQFIICYELGSIITLEATVNDYINHRNVEFDWVQTEGNAVTLSHPKELITTFEYTDNSDKIFRFYIDKDTPRETYVDCRVYHTPISFVGLGFKPHQHTGTSILTVTGDTDTTKTAGYSREVVPTVIGAPAKDFTLEYHIPASLLLVADELKVFYTPDVRLDPYQLLDTYAAPFPTNYVAEKGVIVFELSVTFDSGIQKKYYSHHIVSAPQPVLDGNTNITDDLFPIQVNPTIQNITRFTFLSKVAKTLHPGISGVPKQVSNITRFTGSTCSGELDFSNPIIMGYNIQTQNLVKLDPSGVGSSN